ncbi:SRPBCC family protein [Demequina sp. SO4-18]|uniref:SRPBCC family protein n=1 Tax=Demequina sp. SO4-18 TaxID=3401026 RepID=UPI003B596B08
MPVTSVSTDPESLTTTLIADFAAPVERLWEAYADPRQIERFWGPEGWPATFTRHDFAVGGRSHYYMTGPDGEQFHGLWEYVELEPHARVTVHDKFASSAGVEDPDMPALHMTLRFESTEGGSRLTTVTTFASIEALNEVLAMGAVEGAESSMGQLEGVLADLASFAAGRAAEAQILSDTQVRVSRVVRGTPEQVWQAHHDPELMKRWLLGPDGWTMPVCEIAQEVGDTYRNEWEDENGENRFGFAGELLASEPPFREVTTESMLGMEGEPNINEMTLIPVDDGTLLTVVVTYPNAEVRDIVLGTGMVDGMETSYARLEETVLG